MVTLRARCNHLKTYTSGYNNKMSSAATACMLVLPMIGNNKTLQTAKSTTIGHYGHCWLPMKTRTTTAWLWVKVMLYVWQLYVIRCHIVVRFSSWFSFFSCWYTLFIVVAMYVLVVIVMVFFNATLSTVAYSRRVISTMLLVDTQMSTF